MTNPFADLPTKGGNFMKWPSLGTQVSGVVTSVYVDTPNFEDAEPCPHVVLNTADGEVTISATQTALANLFIIRGEEFGVGDTITVTHSGMSGNAKLFTLDIATAAAQPVAAATPPPAAAPPAAPSVGQAPPIA